MKLLIILLILLNAGCGVGNMMSRECKGELEAVCVFLFGENEDQNNRNIENRVELIEGELEEMVVSFLNIHEELVSLQETSALTSSEINNYQTVLNNLSLQIAEMYTDLRVSELVDPCGDHVNEYDEVLLKMSNGDYIAYFEVGGKRFLTILEENVNYRTTDKQKCDFKIVNGEVVEL